MISVVDRVSTYPGRVRLVPVDGQVNVYDMIRADEPIEEGTLINKELFDSIAEDIEEAGKTGGGGGEVPDGVVYVGGGGEVTEVLPDDAETLGGHPPEYYAKADEVLPLTGGRAVKLSIDKYNTIGQAGFAFSMDGVRQQFFTYDNNADALKRWSTDYKAKTVFDEGTKPTGTYTGNGDATSRTIDTGGIGSVCALWNKADGYGFALVTRLGGVSVRGKTITPLTVTEASFHNGQLKIASTDTQLNGSGTIEYQVL